tara:strand:- start:453 stop:848 length:396 start_codon:yes stop_codon:yes gene_type:complete
MALGFIYDGTTYARPDRSLSRNIAPSTRVVAFGDGYEQRVAEGINSIKEQYNLTFANRPKAEIDGIVKFLNGTHGTLTGDKSVVNFNYTFPDTSGGGTERTVKVVCSNYNVTYNYGDFYSLNLTLRKVFEP